MIIFIMQCNRPRNRQEDVNDKAQVEQGGKLENVVLEEFYILAEQQDSGVGNCQVITKIKKVKELIEECAPMFHMEEKGGILAEDPDIQIQKKTIKELRHDNPVEQSGLIIK